MSSIVRVSFEFDLSLLGEVTSSLSKVMPRLHNFNIATDADADDKEPVKKRSPFPGRPQLVDLVVSILTAIPEVQDGDAFTIPTQQITSIIEGYGFSASSLPPAISQLRKAGWLIGSGKGVYTVQKPEEK